LIALWITCAVGAALIAAGKGRSGGKGFLVGLLLGPMGVLIALGLPDAKRAQELGAQETLRRCPECAELIQRAAVKCRYCGAAISSAAPRRASIAPPPPAPSDSRAATSPGTPRVAIMSGSDKWGIGILAMLTLGGLAFFSQVIQSTSESPPESSGARQATAVGLGHDAGARALNPWPFRDASVAVLLCRPIPEFGVRELYVWVNQEYYALNGVARGRLKLPLVEADYPETPDLIPLAGEACQEDAEVGSIYLKRGV